MEPVNIAPTERSPEIAFDFAANTFSIKGESYPEDVTAFFGPLIEKLEDHLNAQSGASVTFSFELIYFNSSTAKVLMELFDLLDQTAAKGNTVSIAWVFEEDDDNMEELGEEFAEDLEHASFEMKPFAGD